MAPHDYLLDKFDASDETKEAARILLRQVQLKTGPGSGHELGSLKAGLPAACMQIASTRLNNTEVSKNGAQQASCLNKKDYDKVYNIVKTILEENEGERLSYHQLQSKYQIQAYDLKPFYARVENELISGFDMNHQSDAFKGAVFFWICSSAQLRTLTNTQTFSHEHRLPMKKFVDALAYLNKSCSGLRQEIRTHFCKKSSPAKGSNTAPTRQSPRKPSNVASTSLPATEEVEPVRRLLRSAVAQDSTLKTSPVKRPQTSPTKITQPTSFRRFNPAKPQRELPNRDSPKKRAVETKPEQQEDGEAAMEIDSTMESPTKKRKTASTVKLASRPSSPASRPQTRQTNVEPLVLSSPSKANHTVPKPVADSFPRKTTRKTALQAPFDDTESSSDENGPGFGLSIQRRHRPVYLDHRQWNARDPRLDKIWKKADKARKKLKTQESQDRMRSQDNDIMMGE